jgi:diguanylate cyclase (GGDEF)-like protein
MLERFSDSIEVLDIEQIELKEFSQTVSQIEWLLLLLVILYYVAPGTEVSHPRGLVISFLAFGSFSLIFRYARFNVRHYYCKLAVETWVMIAFVTWVLWNTGKINSPLFNLYFLAIICSAMTLGKLITFVEILAIAISYFYLTARGNLEFGLAEFTVSLIYFSPFILVAFFTRKLATNLNHGKKMFKVLSETDEMTDLLNKRSFAPMLKEAAEFAEKYSQPLSVMMIDADNLKDINDKYGHIAGDKLILTIASTIQSSLRTSDIICRYGGDEFVALLPHLTADRAYEAGERLRSAVENSSFDVNGENISSTISVGIATFPENVSDASDLLEMADATLYESKNAGKNTVMSHSQADKQEEPGENNIGGRHWRPVV